MNPTVQKYLPSPSFQKKIGVLLACVIGLFIIHTGMNYYKNYQDTHDEDGNKILSSLVVGDLIQQDRDGDGIPDWEEGLWGTSPDKADTNDDGISDGEEISQKKEFLQKDTGASINNGEKKIYNETELLAHDLFNTTAVLSQAGNVTEKGAQDIADSLVNQISSPSDGYIYTEDDIQIILKTESKTISAYTQKVNTALSKIPQENEIYLGIFNEALTKNDESLLQKLDPYIKKHRVLASDLKKIAVPNLYVESHLAMMNGAEHLANTIESFKQVFNNPIVAMSAFYGYPKHFESYINGIKLYIEINRVYTD